MSFYEWTTLLAAFVVFLIVAVGAVSAVRDNAKDRRVARLTELADAREHELALADREVVMWQAALDHPHPIFSARRTQPVLVGRSQVLGATDSGRSKPKTERRRAGLAQQDMPMPVSEDPSPKVPAPGGLPPALPLDSATTWPSAAKGDTVEAAALERTLPVRQCPSTAAHAGHHWLQAAGEQTWCDGSNADGSTPYLGTDAAR